MNYSSNLYTAIKVVMKRYLIIIFSSLTSVWKLMVPDPLIPIVQLIL